MYIDEGRTHKLSILEYDIKLALFLRPGHTPKASSFLL